MKIVALFLTAVSGAVLLSGPAYAQCSDAGVCAIGYNAGTGRTKHALDVLYRYGSSGNPDRIGYHSLELKAAIGLLENTSLRFSFPAYRSSSGAAGSAGGIGDLMVFLNQGLGDVLGHSMSALLGMRLATGDDNADADLPQAYQPGLGTNDIIFGLKFAGKRYDLAAGYQLVEKTFTRNSLTPIRRGDDLYLQFGYQADLGVVDLKAEAQMIRRLAKTQLMNPDGSVSELDKTDQMQINLGAEARYELNRSGSLVGGFAFPILKRESNVDGLTRALTFFAGWRQQL